MVGAQVDQVTLLLLIAIVMKAHYQMVLLLPIVDQMDG